MTNFNHQRTGQKAIAVVKEKSKLFLWDSNAIYIGPLSDNSQHKHLATQICFSLDTPFQILIEGHWRKVKFAALPANSPHQLNGGQSRIVIILIDGESVLGRAVSNLGVLLNDDIQSNLLNLPDSLESAKAYLNKLADGLVKPDAPPPTPADFDKRVLRAIDHISHNLDRQISGAELAELVNISQSRFLHLFSQNAGLPLRRYILWRRIILSIAQISQGADLTGAAHMGGFSDSAHFSRVFRETFGLAPATMFKNSQNIQVFTQ